MAVVLSQPKGKGKKLILKLKLSATNFPGGSNVVGLWRLDTNEIVGHTEVSDDASPTFTTEFNLDHYLSADLKVKFCVYSVVNGCVDESGFVGCHETSLGALFKGKKSEALLSTGAGLNFDCVVLPDPNQKKKEKKVVETGPQLSKEEKKAIALSFKEGGKKGQDLCGMSSFGVHFFCVSIESCPDNWDLFQQVMDGMNKEVDPEADDRKGGAADLAKILFCAGPTKVMMFANVPPEQAEKATVKEFLEAVCAPIDGKITEDGEFFMKAEAAGDPDNNRFPLKMRDQAIAAGFDFLRAKQLVLDDDSDDDINFADECGIDLNAGANAEDY
jgi:hypothetical protein